MISSDECCWQRQGASAMDYLLKLEEALSVGSILRSQEIGERYYTTFFGQSGTQPAALLRPKTTEELSRALAICNEYDLKVVPQGGMTGLVTAALPQPREIVVSLERMNRILEVDRLAGTMTVEAGATLQSVHEAAEAQGLMFPLDLASRGSATIGGNIATNAGGNMVLRYGMMRELVLGVQAVIADGTIVDSMYYHMKNNTGYDVKQYFIGTEGTLGIVTKAVLRLWPGPAERAVGFCAVSSFENVCALLNHARSSLEGKLIAFEAMWGSYYKLAGSLPGNRLPLEAGQEFYVLIETAGSLPGEAARLLESALEACLENGILADAVVAKSDAQAKSMWRVRETALEVVALKRPFMSFDVCLRLDTMQSYLNDVRHETTKICAETFVTTIGHLGDGNLHIAIHYPSSGESAAPQMKDTFYRVTGDYGGSISAEHGIGIEKRKYLHHSRNKAELDLMLCVKRALDPKNILSPGRIFDAAAPAR